MLKGILRKILKRTILKKIGLDICTQLIVGSAPISTGLLYSFNDLDIQIYNAYGLTEAPLLTINKLGSNRIGTFGEPLPHTNIKINKDGEVLVQGPQVTSGYFNNNHKNLSLQNGWFYTGDYGYLTEEGSLVIIGRKKELIVNSYGKNISSLKIEGLIKHIPGISEVMVVGDEKPYCTALIWVDKTINYEKIVMEMEDMNSKLSNPEKIKRWLILRNDLTIENGDLTANLKLKRENILKRHKNLLNNIYDDKFIEKLTKELKQNKILYLGWEGQ
ncbi:MAG: AMP-binding protein [Methanobacterium sp.]|nr:AMP-binding protein [Methanobacterium sp.]